jgi:hypothetical protein
MAVGQYYSPCALVLEQMPTERVQFESFPADEGITEGYNADYVKTGGRAAEPYGRMWQGGDWNPINITLEFHAGMSYLEVGTPGQVIGQMIKKVDWLKALPFPRPMTRPMRAGKSDLGKRQAVGVSGFASYGGQTADPPIVLFVWGLFMTLKGRVTAWTVTWKGPYEVISGKPHHASVALTFQPESGFYPNWYDIVDGYRGVPTAFLGRFI